MIRGLVIVVKHFGNHATKQYGNSTRFLIFPILVLSSALIVAVEKVRLFYAAGWPDPFYNIGYATNMRALQNRDGPSYTATRIPAITLIKIQNFLRIDNQSFRILLLAFCTLFVILLVKKISAATYFKSFLIAIFLMNNLMFLRHISDDYSLNFSMVVEFPIVYICFILMSGFDLKRRAYFNLGFLIMIAALCNISVLIIITPIIASTFYYLLKDQRLKKSNLGQFLLGILFTAVLTVTLSLFYAGVNSLRNFRSLVGVIFSIQTNESTLWTKSIFNVFAYLLLFTIIFILGIESYKNILRNISWGSFKSFLGNRTAPKFINGEPSERIFVCGMLTILIGVAYHQVLGGPLLSYSFYSNLYIPLIVLMLCVKLRSSSNWALLVSLILQIVLLRLLANNYLINLFKTPTKLRVITLFLLFIFWIFFAFLKPKRILLPIALSIFLILAPLNETWNMFTIRSNGPLSGEYIDFARSWKSSFQEDVQNIALQFSKYVYQKVPADESLWIVYPSDYGWMTSISSTQLYGYSCFHCTDSSPPIKGLTELSNLNEFAGELEQRKHILVLSPVVLRNGAFSSSNSKGIIQLNHVEVFHSNSLNLFLYDYKLTKFNLTS